MTKIALIACSLLISSYVAIGSTDLPIIDDIATQCGNFNSVRTLDEFGLFENNYEKLNDCLHSATVNSEYCRLADEICSQNGILYANVRTLARLINRFQQQQPVCTIEYSSGIYRIHQQISMTESGDRPRLARILRALANRVASRCRQSLANRLLCVDQKAPDTIKHIGLILSLLNISPERLGKLELGQVEQFAPILEQEQVFRPEDSSIGLSPSGFEFKLSLKQGLDASRMSCNALKPYHVNILGSLGLLASAGYGASLPFNEELAGDAARIRVWLLSAVICQSLKSVAKMSSLNLDGKIFHRIKILPAQEADVSSQDELDTTFSTYNLPESGDTMDFSSESAIDSFVYNNTQINFRKSQLLYGPSYKLASALYAYLDITSKLDRTKIPYAILGIEVPEKSGYDIDEEDDDD